MYMLLFTTIFVFNKLTILQGITQKKFPAVPIWLFHVNKIETQNDNVYLSFCWSWWGGWKRGANRIRKHWFWGLKHLLHTSKSTFMSWLLDALDLPSRRKDTHRLMSRVDYGFNQWPVVRLVIKKLHMYLFMVKQCTYLVILMQFMQIYFHLFWFGINLQILLYFWIFVDPTPNLNYQEKQNSEKIQRVKKRLSLKTNDISLTISNNILYSNFMKSR